MKQREKQEKDTNSTPCRIFSIRRYRDFIVYYLTN